MTIDNLNQVTAIIVALIVIGSAFIGTIAWFLRLEFRTRRLEEQGITFKHDLDHVKSTVEIKVDNVQNSMNTVLISLGELKGRMEGHSNNAR